MVNTKIIDYLCFTALENNSTITIVKRGNGSPNLEYSNNGKTWHTFNPSVTITLAEGKHVYIAGNNSILNGRFVMSGSIKASGNIMSLLSKDNFENTNTVPANGFNSAFKGCTSLVKAPILPATILGNSAYYEMFSGCTNLVIAPELPATTLNVMCYYRMFENTPLINAPNLPALVLKLGSYREMFKDCTSLITPPTMLATSVDVNACTYMFQNCNKLTKAPDLMATILTGDCCYSYMFSGAQKLSYVKMLALNINVSNTKQLDNWMMYINNTSGRIFVKHIDAIWTNSGVSGVLSNWTIIYYDPALDKYYLDQNRSTECDDHGNVIN